MNIKELQNKANDSSITVSSLLRDAKLLASRLDQEDFETWIDKELNGYKEKVPEYRVVRGVPQGFNPYRGWIPYVHSDSKSQDIISQRGVSQSVAELEELLKSSQESFEMKYPADTAKILREGVGMDVDLRLVIGRSEVAGILEHIRNRILDWTIQLQKKGIPDESTEFTKEEIKEAEKVESKYHIEHIENFKGNLGESGTFELKPGSVAPRETFLDKFIWLVLVALVVLILGNILSALILHFAFGIG